ncbi:hypothetical protein OA867_01770 [Prochlorococcus sp. AH-716-D22]|nr:hypothetical protein [Prochlorococcus sp. AH-716-D22]
MTLLYIGLGMAMISGISAMMKIGNNVNDLMSLSTFKQNNYYQSTLPSYDRRILDIINNYSGPDSDICSNIKQNLNDTLYEDGELFLSTGTQTPSINSLFLNSCVLVNKDLKHRVLINKNELGTFNLFSCYLKEQTYCPYEVNK